MREFFIQTERIGFSMWKEEDSELAESLWGDPEVTRYISADGKFSREQINARLQTEISNGEKYHVQYYPIFVPESGELIGCCGLRPYFEDLSECNGGVYEIGFHLRRKFWGNGYAKEAASAVIDYAFEQIKAEKLFAGHHPENQASRILIEKLGFREIGRRYYKPTGLNHPSYELTYEQWCRR